MRHTSYSDGEPLGRRIEWRAWIESAVPVSREEIERIPLAELGPPRVWNVWP